MKPIKQICSVSIIFLILFFSLATWVHASDFKGPWDKNNFQKTIAEKVIINLNNQKIWDTPIVTSVEPLEIFYFAESYHKDYYKKHPDQAYCQVTIAPKVIKLKQKYLSKLKSI